MFDLSTAGIFLYILYPIIIISISIYSLRNKEVTLSSYFFANRNISWWTLGVSFTTTSVLSPYIFGLTGSNIEIPLIYGITSIFMLVLLGYFLAPIFIKLRITTIPEYFELRFNRASRLFLTVLYVFNNIFFRMSVILIAGSVFFNLITGYDAFTSLIYFLLITGIYVIIGGLQSEIHVNLIQFFFLLVSTVAFAGWIISQDKAIIISDKLTSFLSFQENQGSGFSPVSILIGLPVIGLWFWCTDQIMVQRTLSAKNFHHLRKAALFSAFLQVVPILIVVLPALIGTVLFQGNNFEGNPQKLFRGNSLPIGLRFTMIIAAVSALMSSFAGVFNSTSTLITFDFYSLLKPGSSDRKLVLVGRLTTLFILFCSILLIPNSQSLNFSSCLNLLSIAIYFSAMTASVFLIGLLSKKINRTYILPALIVTTGIILLRVATDTIFRNQEFEDELIDWLIHSDFLQFSVFIFLMPVISIFSISVIIQSYNKLSAFQKRRKEVSLRLKYK